MSIQKPDTQGSIPKSPSELARLAVRCPLFLGDTAGGIKVNEFLNTITYSIVITVVTIITLFSDDIRQIFFTQDSDVGFSILTAVCMSIFGLEMILLSFTKEGYFLRFYFWLDLISTLTMLLDMVWIGALINGSGTGLDAATKVARIARAARASRIGAQSTKMIRIIRLIRVLKLYKTASKELSKENVAKIEAEAKQLESRQLVFGTEDRMNKKQSKRLDRIREASSGIVMDPIAEKRGSRHQVSLKNITFQGSQRKLSVLYPVHKFSAKLPSNNRLDQAEKLSSSIIRDKQDKLNKDGSEANVNNPFNSENNVASEDANNLKRESQHNTSGESLNLPSETRVGLKLKDEIQKNIVSMILLILLSIPLINVDTWYSNVTSFEKSASELAFFAQKGSAQFDAQASAFISQYSTAILPLIYFSVPVNSSCCQFPRDYPSYIATTRNISNMRTQDTLAYAQGDEKSNITVAFDETNQNILASQLNIGRTLFVCVMLIVMTLLFSQDVQVEALEPLENMIETVKKISSNPLQAIKDIQKENLLKSTLKNAAISQNQNQQTIVLPVEEEKQNQTEPMILENMIVKIGSLLTIGFGEAGTELIARNIESYGSLNVMMPGRKAMCIFGFCDIRNFTDATEVLQSKVMVFVNEIAEICHDTVNRVGGNPNKNIGDAFLLVWKFGEEDTQIVQNRHGSHLELQSSLKVRQTADLAVYSFVKMIAQITRSQKLQKYKENPDLQKRIKNYQGVKMGFGLHVGEAIEGPIGSEFKIDASYLGANVNVAGRLEAATKHYGVPLLVSGELYNLMTIKNKEHLRQVDKVQLKQGEKPLELYTVDVSTQNLLKKMGIHNKKQLSAFEKKKIKVYHNQVRDKLLKSIVNKRITTNIWNDCKQIKAMRQPFSKYFYDEWRKGYEAYDKGDWATAKQIITRTYGMGLNHEDGPSKALLDFMEQSAFVPPANWSGVKDFVA